MGGLLQQLADYVDLTNAGAAGMDRLRQAASGAVDQLGKVPASIQLDGSSGPGDGEPFNPNAKGLGGQVEGIPRGLHYWLSGGGVNAGITWINEGPGGGARGGSGSRSGDWGGVNIPGDSSRGGGGASGGRDDGPGGPGRGPQWTNLNAMPGGGVFPGPGGPIIPPAMMDTQQAQLVEAQKQTAALEAIARAVSGDNYLTQRAAGNI